MIGSHPSTLPTPCAAPHPRAFVSLLAGVFGLALVCGGVAIAVEPAPPPPGRLAKRSFDIPAGDAFATLKCFFAQSGEQVIYRADAMEGVRTHPVKGEFTPLEALRLMLNPAAFAVSRDDLTGALAIKPIAAPANRPAGPPPGKAEGNALAKKKRNS